MLRPEKLEEGPFVVRCNCCENFTTARMSDLENVDGSDFDYLAWKKSNRLSNVTDSDDDNYQPETAIDTTV